MYKKAGKSHMRRKLHETKANERKPGRRPRRRRVSHYRGEATTELCCICKVPTPGPAVALRIGDKAMCDICQGKYFRSRENAKINLKAAIDIAAMQDIDIRAAIYKLKG